MIQSGTSYRHTDTQTHPTTSPAKFEDLLMYAMLTQTKKPPTSLSFLTIIILLIYFTRLQLKSFKYKFFLYRKCNKVKIVPCVIHSIIAMLTKFCIECARIDVI